MFALAVSGYAQTEMRNTITVGAGIAHNTGNTCCGESAPSIEVNYSFRFMPHIELTAGANFTTSLGTEIRGANYDFRIHDRLTWVPFGINGILPLSGGRTEAFIGAGGVYERYSVGNPEDFVGATTRDGWGGYATGGARFALDRRRHFWLGGSTHYYFANTNNGYTHDRWLTANVDVGFRF
jgi:hypothetical protein